MMETRKLGRRGLQVSAVGLGCAGFAGNYGAADDDECIRTIHAATELGITFFDTSDIYGNGKNEELIARAIRDRRDRVIIATKFGNVRTGSQRGLTNGRPDYVPVACDASLQRLGIDVIDLYYEHRIDPTVPIEETVGAMARLVEQGKVRYLGLCEAGEDTVRRAHRVHPLSALQTEYSLWSRELEPNMIPLLRELGIGLVPYSPLGRGFLTGSIQKPDDMGAKDRRHEHPRFQGENLQRNLDLLEPIRTVAKAHGASMAQVALGWVLAQGSDIVPIPGTKTRKYLKENTTKIVLSDSDLRRLDSAFPLHVAAGPRYPESQLKGMGI
jgi:aryl-alcohol dehydrogenase-like predicted oxidoreductase